MQTKKILIVGSGSILTKALIGLWKNKHSVTIVYSGSNPAIEHESANFIKMDSVFEKAENYDALVIISAYIPAPGICNNETLFDVNVALVEKLASHFTSSKIIFCSTISVYKPQPGHLITEDDLVLPQNEYAVSKLWAEHIIRRNCHNYAIFRISSLVGQTMKQNTFIPQIIKQAKEKKEITLFGDGSRIQNYIHVSDVAGMIDSSIDLTSSGLYLAVNPFSYANKEVASVVTGLVKDSVIAYSGDDKSSGYSFNAEKTYAALDYRPSKNIEFMIRELL